MSRFQLTSTWNRWQGECRRNPSERRGSCPRAPCPRWTEPSPSSKLHSARCIYTKETQASLAAQDFFISSLQPQPILAHPVRIPASLFLERKHTTQMPRANKNSIKSSTTTLLAAVSLGDVCLQVEAAQGLRVTCY